MIRVLLAEDHTIVRKGLRSLLENQIGIEVIGEAGRRAVADADSAGVAQPRHLEHGDPVKVIIPRTLDLIHSSTPVLEQAGQ